MSIHLAVCPHVEHFHNPVMGDRSMTANFWMLWLLTTARTVSTWFSASSVSKIARERRETKRRETQRREARTSGMKESDGEERRRGREREGGERQKRGERESLKSKHKRAPIRHLEQRVIYSRPIEESNCKHVKAPLG